MPKVHIIIPAIGDAHFVEKLGILDRNLARICQFRESANIELSIQFFLYSLHPTYLQMVLDIITKHISREKITYHIEPGYLGEFIYRYIKPENMVQYDYLFFLLDDVELSENFFLDRWILCYQVHQLDILSPTIKRECTSHQVMKQLPYVEGGKEVSIVNMCEFFSYFLTPAVYSRYYQLFDENTRSMWGIDLVLYHAGFKMGLHNKVTLHHYYSGSINSVSTSLTSLEMNNFLRGRNHIHCHEQRVLYYEPCILFYFNDLLEDII